MNIKTYRKEVKAVQLTTENVFDVAKWCGGVIRQPGNPGVSSACIRLPISRDGTVLAHSDEWIVQDARGEFTVHKAPSFAAQYKEVTNDA